MAGGPIEGGVFQCALQPVERAIAQGLYGSWSPSAGEVDRLKAIFPGGVCDYTKPGVSQHGAVSWLTYQTRRGRVIYGGKRLGRAPRSHRIR